MKKKLTAAIIDEIKTPLTGQVETYDEEIAGLAIRVSKGGTRVWTLKYRSTGGVQRRLKLGDYPRMTVAQARREAARIKLQVRVGNDPAADRDAKRAEKTLRELIEECLSDSRARKLAPHTIEVQTSNAKNVDSRLLSKPISSITLRDIEAMHHRLSEHRIDDRGLRRGGHYAANNTVRFLRDAFNKAISWGWMPDANPCKNIKLHREPKREEFLSVEQIAAVNRALMEEPDWRWRAYFPLVLMTGTRKSELLRARWEHVDFKERIIRIPRTKSGKPLRLPYGDAAAAIIENLPSRGDSEWLFPSKLSRTGYTTSPDDAWQRIRKRAGIPTARPHDLRHTLASQMRLSGYDLKIISDQLNHADIGTTARYANVSLDSRREAAIKMEQHMGFSAQLAAIDDMREHATPPILEESAHKDTEPDAMQILRDSQVG